MTAVRLLLPQGGLRRWHRALAERLAAERHRVLIETRERRGAPPPSTALIEALEDLIARPRPPATLDRAPPGAWSAPGAGDADLVFDLTGSAEPEPGAIVPLYDGAAGDAARDAALLDGRAPWIELAQSIGDAPARLRLGAAGGAATRPALLGPRGGRRRARRAGRPARRARPRRGRPPRDAAPRAGRPPPSASPRRRSLGLIERRLRRLVVHDGHWRVGVRRRAPGEAPFAGLDRLDDGGWRWLPDDRRRYFADPFVFEEGGAAYVFCEEYPYATGKGVISVFALDDEGNPGPPRVVLERPYHLSYPFVFRHDGAIWMMPESGQNRTLELYRADAFPFRWTLDRVLMSGVEIADATPFVWDGEWWLSGDRRRNGRRELGQPVALSRRRPARTVDAGVRRAGADRRLGGASGRPRLRT